ncbi:MAG: hypothetical protein GXY44_04670 [Phycisphaerales bacterium]|nr:hypothetical protein [Phycisphaerales bacterium]
MQDHVDHSISPPDQPLEKPLPTVEEPLDVASQSLADALRASFWVLKFVMLLVFVAYLLSGVFIVDQNQVAVVSRFGHMLTPPRQPGLHFAWPLPIDSRTKVPTSPRTISIDDFWLRLREADTTRPLSELTARSETLDPEFEGALLTGDKAIMHLQFTAQYRIADAVKCVSHVGDNFKNTEEDAEKQLLQKVLQNAAVAEAARTTMEVVWKTPGLLAAEIQKRAQQTLDRLDTGIILDQVSAERSHYPLQTAFEFNNVMQAEQQRNELIQGANKEKVEKLNAAAGPAWEDLDAQIRRLDMVKEESPEWISTIDEIHRLLDDKATGNAGGLIHLARSEASKIIQDTLAETNQFASLLPEYRRNPELLREVLRQRMLHQLYTMPGVSKWLLPPGQKTVNLWLNKDPVEIREAERERTEQIRRGG